VLYLIDESGGVPPAIGRAAEQGLSNCKVGVIAQAGNPMSLESLLYESVTKLRAQWSVVRITGDPDDSARSPRIDVTWAREQIALYGRENPWVKIYILGMFPPSSVNALIGPTSATRRRSGSIAKTSTRTCRPCSASTARASAMTRPCS
jgi:hypothetical protein